MSSGSGSGLPPSQGLYDPQYEHDSCGLGFVVDLKGRKSHKMVLDGLKALENLSHIDAQVFRYYYQQTQHYQKLHYGRN